MVDTEEFDRNYKVGDVLARYDLTDLHDRLPGLWLGEEGEEESLRTLAERINIALVRQAMREAGEDPLDGEAENTYRLLTDDDVSAGVRTQQRNRLERAGVDVDQLMDDFVTHQAVHTYLRKGLGYSKESKEESDPLEKHRTRVQRLRNRLDAVTTQSVSELQSAGALSVGDPEAIVSVQVYCERCGTQYDFAELLDAGACDCESGAEDGETDASDGATS